MLCCCFARKKWEALEEEAKTGTTEPTAADIDMTHIKYLVLITP
jgi:hypothetical protein